MNGEGVGLVPDVKMSILANIQFCLQVRSLTGRPEAHLLKCDHQPAPLLNGVLFNHDYVRGV